MPDLDPFTLAYIEAALWTETDLLMDDDQFDTPKIEAVTIDLLAPDTLEQMVADCAAFQRDMLNAVAIVSGGEGWERAGHDFWLTRNGHGVGFWDGRWPEPQATVLTEACKAAGRSPVSLYVGDDGLIHAD